MTNTAKQQNLLFYLSLLLALTPLVHTKTAIFGTVVHRTIYFWSVIDIGLLILIIRRQIISPKFSFLSVSILAYLVISLISALFGYDIYLNLFSNFERMMGFLTLLHFVIFFFLFADASFSSRELNILLLMSLLIGFGISIFGISETLNGRHYRAESILSNPMHFAIYLVAQIYLGIYCFYRWQNSFARLACIFYLLISLFALILTQTRAGIISLGAGLLVAVIIYIAQSAKKLRYSAYLLLSLVLIAGLGWLSIHYLHWQKLPILQRLARINFTDDTILVRFKLWKMCLLNSFERPLLGWGQGSFIYFYFNHFTSDLNNAGFWYDSAHNNFIDTIIGMGYIGLIAYCSVFGAAFYTIWHKKGTYFSATEKRILTSFLAAYLVFMFFGFDSFISYFGLFIFLIIVQKNSASAWSFHLNPIIGTRLKLIKVFTGVGSIALLYFFCFKSIQTNRLLTKASAENEVNEMIHLYKEAYQQSIIGAYDVAMSFALKKEEVFKSTLPVATKNNYFSETETLLSESLHSHPNNPILLNQKAFLEYESGKIKEGIKTFELINRLSPDRLINQYDYALVLFNNNEVSKSIAVLDKVIKTQQFNDKAILLEARIYFQKQNPEQAFETLMIFDPKGISKNFSQITDMIFEYGQYKPFFDFMVKKFRPEYHGELNHLGDLVLTDEQLLNWAQIAQLSKDKDQISTVFFYHAGTRLFGADGYFKSKQDSVKISNLIDEVYQGKANYDVIMKLRDF